MGQLVNGKWIETDVRAGEKNDRGEFIRKPMSFRGTISKNGDHPPKAGRYHLYVSYACPWAHRTLIMRVLKGLQNAISIDVVSPNMMSDGWSFLKDYDQIPHDSLFGKDFLREVYVKADPNFTGRVTVPVLWDKKNETIVNNESSEIIRILNSEFEDFASNRTDYFPEENRAAIEKWNDIIYPNINNGVYRCGFARSQTAYNEAFSQLFNTLDRVESHLAESTFLVGESLTEADIRLFTTLIRFDDVYHTHFKCNGKLIREYPHLSTYVDRILHIEGVRDTINMDHIKQHYYFSHDSINPSRIVARGPLNL